MRVVVASTFVPFIRGGGRMIVDSLAAELKGRGFQTDIVQIPFRSFWRDLAEQTLAIRLMDLTESAGNSIDRLITIRYPSFALRHPNKVSWFIHHHRSAYDLWGSVYQDFPATPEGWRAREALIRSDTTYLREARAIYANSRRVADRLKEGNGIDADGVVYPPLPNPEVYTRGAYGDYFVYSARVTPLKRQSLLIDAMRVVRSNFKLILIGTGDSEAYWTELNALVERDGLSDRVRMLGWVSEEEKARITSNAFAALYIPYDEDSYGYSSLEAFHSYKPVITCTDSGGPNEVIVDGFNGLVVEPTPEALAGAMERLWARKDNISQLGMQANDTLRRHNINWDSVIDRLTG